MTSHTATHESPQAPKPASRVAQYWALTKPRVTQLAVFCAIIGMFLATDGLPPWRTVLAATVGIWLLTSAAFAFNCLIEASIDARAPYACWLGRTTLSDGPASSRKRSVAASGARTASLSYSWAITRAVSSFGSSSDARRER